MCSCPQQNFPDVLARCPVPPLRSQPGTYMPAVAGNSGRANGSSCLPCAVGSFQDQAGKSSCKPCLAGTEALLAGLDECQKCVEGYFNNKAGEAAVLH